ncbi:MAG: type II secretion system F family protein [Meiothermus sp.]|uniref:type II secretion system F family protein n=1 Tax=Meiothermus sp. TaxID=1955249 RepID=UPI00298F21B8|nr:type II secretion system F family protein [Meiothermus sp.]MDW8480890.1 type II secretion system F family protein [Meiothermus sp.]
MRFLYEATDSQGERIYRGVVEAESPQGARRRLREMGLYPLRLERVRRSLRGRLPLTELVLFMEEFATLVGAGVSVAQALHTLSLEGRHPLLKEAARGVRERVEGGEGLAQAMGQYPEVFPPLVRALVAAAEVGGALEVVLRRIAEYLDKSQDLREKVRTALLYPSFVVAVLVLVVAALLLFVIPVFARLYGAAGAELPWPTRFLIGASAFVRENGLWILLFLLALAYFLRAYHQTPRGARLIGGLLLRLPLVGAILHKAAMARFARTLATLYEGGVLITQALEAARNTLGNAALAEALDRILEWVVRGESLSNAMGREPLFLPILVRLTLVGEEAGSLDRMLYQAASHLEREVDYGVKRLSSSLEPALTVALGGILLVVALALYLPLFDLPRILRR